MKNRKQSFFFCLSRTLYKKEANWRQRQIGNTWDEYCRVSLWPCSYDCAKTLKSLIVAQCLISSVFLIGVGITCQSCLRDYYKPIFLLSMAQRVLSPRLYKSTFLPSARQSVVSETMWVNLLFVSDIECCLRDYYESIFLSSVTQSVVSETIWVS